MFYIVEPWGRDKFREAAIIYRAVTVDDAYAELDRLVARLQHFSINPASFEWYVVDEQRNPVRRLGAH
jgi:hypothetical protein